MSFSASIRDLVEVSEEPLVQAASLWPREPLGNVAKILNGFPFKSDHFTNGAGDPLIRIRDVTSGRTETRYVGPQVEGYWVEPGDLVVGMDGDFSSRIWTAERGLLNQRVCKITPDERVLNLRFLSYLLPGYLRLINDATHAVTVKHLSSKTLQELPVPLPPLAEQRRIVAKLDALTARTARARADLDRIPALAARYKQAVLAKAFSGELTADLEVDVSDLLAGTFTAEDVSGRSPAVGDLPEGWLWTSVGALTAVTGGLTKNAKRATAPLQVSYLRVANVYADELRLNDVAMIGCTEGEFEKTRLQRGDLLIVEGNGSLEQVGRAAVWNEELKACSHQNHLIRLRTAKQLMPRYLLLWLSSPAGRVAIEGVASSSSGLHTLSVSKVKGLPLPLCGLDQQKVIVGRVDRAFAEVDRLIAEAASARRLLDRLNQAVLAKAFRGELVDQGPTDEPASLLLDRIRAERAAAPRPRRGRKVA